MGGQQSSSSESEEDTWGQLDLDLEANIVRDVMAAHDRAQAGDAVIDTNESGRPSLTSSSISNSPSSVVSVTTNPEYSLVVETEDEHHTSESHGNQNKFYCYICMEMKSLSRGFELPCKHVFCQPCLQNYLTSKITEANTLIGCFHPVIISNDEGTESSPRRENNQRDDEDKTTCAFVFDDDSIASVVKDPALVDKYKRFKFMKLHPHARECPKCSAFTTSGSDENHVIVCERSQCAFKFCYIHADAHPDETCEQYETRSAVANKASLELIATMTKKCPGCGSYIKKDGGCNHMKCPSCSQTFCWLCLEKVDDAVFPAHFQWWNVNGTCANLQMDEAIEPSAGTRNLATFFMVLQIIILGPIVLLSTIVTFVLIGWCVKREQLGEFVSNCFSNWGIIWMFVLVLLPISSVVFGFFVAMALFVMLVFPFHRMATYALKRTEGRPFFGIFMRPTTETPSTNERKIYDVPKDPEEEDYVSM